MRRIGRGHAALFKLCGTMNMPPPVSKSNFSAHQKVLKDAVTLVALRRMRDAAEEVKAVNTACGQDDPTHIAVTFDGTWMKRGFSSLHGVFSCIS